MSKLKELQESRAALFTQLEELRKQTDGREMTDEEQSKWDNLSKDYLGADKRVSQEQQFLDAEKRQISNPTLEVEVGTQKNDYNEAFRNYLTSGASGLSSEAKVTLENRAGITGINGKILVPETLAGEIETALKSYGGMLEAGTIIATNNGGDLIIPTVNDTASKATIVAEYDETKEGNITFGSITLKSFTYRTPMIPISLELLQDSAFNIESVVSSLLSDSFGRGINEHLTTGDGQEKPTGIIPAAFQSEATPTANAIKLDDILDLMKGIDSNYAKNAKFMFNTKTLFALMKIKDTTGNYIWRDAVNGVNPTLFGKGYIINDDMPDIGPANASVLYGDLKKYKIRMVKGFNIIRLNEALAKYLAIGIYGFARYDGKLIDAGTHPIHKLVHAAS